MTESKNIKETMREHKTLFVIIAVALFLLELEIFAVAVMKSGRHSRLQVMDQGGNVIHETDGDNLSEFNKYYFEKTFGSLDQYRVNLVTKERPFPFRAWFVAAVGIPVGIVLLFAFVVKSYVALFHGEESANPASDPAPGDRGASRFEDLLSRVGRFNIFTIGFLIFLALFSYWVVPNFITLAGKIGMETLVRFKTFFIVCGLIFLAVVVWVIYLRYRLAVKTIESRTEIEKERLQLEMAADWSQRPQIGYRPPPEENEDRETDLGD